MAQNRGLVLHHVMGTAAFAKGTEARQRILAAVPSETRAVLEGPLLSASWYDERHAVELTRAVADVLGLTDEEVVRYFRDLQLDAYGRIYKMILPFMSPAALLQRAPWFWRRQHDTGELVVDVAEESCAAGRIIGNENACDDVYSLVVLGGMIASVTLTGASEVWGERDIAGPREVRFRLGWGKKA